MRTEKKPKGNGIIGGDPFGEEAVYAVVFWLGWCEGVRITLAAFLSVFVLENAAS